MVGPVTGFSKPRSPFTAFRGERLAGIGLLTASVAHGKTPIASAPIQRVISRPV